MSNKFQISWRFRYPCLLMGIAFMVLLVIPCHSCIEGETTPKETHYYAVEINNVLCGYIKMTTYSFIENEKEYGLIRSSILNKLSVLGGDADIRIASEMVYDPESQGYISQVSDISIGKMKMHTEIRIKDNQAYYHESTSGTEKTTELDPDVIVELPINNPHLKKDFIDGQLMQKSYRVFDDRTGDVVEKTYTKLGEEELLLAGKLYKVIVLEELYKSMGLKVKLYLDINSGVTIRQDPAEDRSIYLADASVVDNIGVADMNDVLLAKVDVSIPEIRNLSYMKVRAKLKSTGEWISADKLSFPGQSFSGVVEDNHIEGVFTIEPRRYGGEGAPGFPYDYELPDTLKKYTEPEVLIESKEPVLIREAEEITTGARDSWEAVVRLSSWVDKNIEGAIPGGTSAINTYRIREGECGSHSRLLTAFCRAVGIPARLAIGCAYVNMNGGLFGQHAWTEVHMGNAGWVPVDATFGEIDYIDAGHIRLGEKSSFLPSEMEILDYRLSNN